MKRKRTIINIIITLLFALVLFYFFLPPLNISSPDFWTYVVFIIIVYIFISLVGALEIKTGKYRGMAIPNGFKYLIIGTSIIFALILIVNLVISPIFNSKSYRSRITITEGNKFSDNIKEADFSKMPLLDKDSSRKLGDRVMGEMQDLVSQFTVSELYTQINFNNQITRVTPLEYDGLIKYFTNKSEGVKGYITVDSVNGETKLTRLDKGMKYMPSAYFFENLERKLRFAYPTLIFGDESFELDNEGNPFWIVPIIKYAGVGLREEISGVVILDPITGKSKKYDVGKIPSWVDHVYNADLILEQVDDWGLYTNGFWNSLFGQKNVTMTTEGYNYLVMEDDVYLYTGITSVVSDESNLGFILCNMRTKETMYYLVPGAEEYSAMDSAKGQVQEKNYTATFPLLINLEDRPTYLISLKDAAGLVKMYAFVDVQDYQKVTVTDSSKGIEAASKNYLNNSKMTQDESKTTTKDITIKTITTTLIDGNTYYYLTDTKDQKYRISIKINENLLPFLKLNEKVKVSYSKEKDVIEIIKISK